MVAFVNVSGGIKTKDFLFSFAFASQEDTCTLFQLGRYLKNRADRQYFHMSRADIFVGNS